MATHPKVVFVTFLIVGLLYCVHPIPNNDTEIENGQENSSYSHVLYPRDKLIEEFKATFLRKLNMTKPPEVSDLQNISSEVVHLLMEDEEDRFQSKNIIYPENDVYSCIESSRPDCSRFEFKILFDLNSVEKVFIWFRKRKLNRSVNFSVRFQNSTGVHLYYESTSDVKKERLWIRFQLKKSALEHVNETLRCTIEVSGLINPNNTRPFLAVITRDESTSRLRRDNSIKAGNNSKCRAVDRVISFSEMKWRHWVYEPAVLNIRACSGTCPYDQGTFNISYGSLAYNYGKLHPLQEDNECSKFWVPRCYPNKMTSVKIIYFKNNTRNLVMTELQDMVVDSCSCMSYTCFASG